MSDHLLAHVVNRPDRYRLLVVCSIREPIARNVSAYFYSTDPTHLASVAQGSAEGRTDRLRDDFLASWDHDRALDWMDREIEDQLGFELTGDFDLERGYATYDNATGGRCLVIRQEDLDAAGPEALSAFLGRRIDDIPRTNVGGGLPHGELYREFLRAVDLPTEYVERMYASSYARTYYSAAERARLATRWTTAPGTGEVDEEATGT